ncbi:MAG: decaprenyl-phosphate phosphoribosyltransferase [Vicinamibacterales bacterium]
MTRALAATAVDPATHTPSRRRSTAVSLLSTVRPEQWTKNLFVFAALLFAKRLEDIHAVVLATETFVIFCALSGAVYIFNDIADRTADREHPLKRLRPIASGDISPLTAGATGVLLGGGAVAASWAIAPALALTAAGYLLLQVAYSLVLKHVVILDALAIASGFVLRAVAGGVAIAVPVSNWLLACTTLLALFLALAKRRHELTTLAAGAARHRPILEEYNPYLIDQMIAVVTASAVVAYAAYTTSPETAAKLGTEHLTLTIPFVLYGIFRYLYLVHRKDGGGNPSTLLLTDVPLLACVALWAAATVILLYTPLGQL